MIILLFNNIIVNHFFIIPGFKAILTKYLITNLCMMFSILIIELNLCINILMLKIQCLIFFKAMEYNHIHFIHTFTI